MGLRVWVPPSALDTAWVASKLVCVCPVGDAVEWGKAFQPLVYGIRYRCPLRWAQLNLQQISCIGNVAIPSICVCGWELVQKLPLASYIHSSASVRTLVVAIYSHFPCDREHLLCIDLKYVERMPYTRPWSSHNASEACLLVSWSRIVFWKGIQHPSISIFSCSTSRECKGETLNVWP